MQSDNDQGRKFRALILVFLSAVIIIAATYAWFIGMREVNLSSFSINVSSTDSLLLSTNGVDWSDLIDINRDNLEAVSYPGHTNSWSRGITPVSSIGELDPDTGRLKFYKKSSLVTTAGGFRLMAEQIDNLSNPEALEPVDYVVFDLFIKNFTGRKYSSDLDPASEEAIYLTVDSEVKVSSAGVSNMGIENSVRVAFAQIGRVNYTTYKQDIITGITCTDTEFVTGICRDAQIWEPNDVAHVSYAIKYYEMVCKKRLGSALIESNYYGACNRVVNGLSYPTYVLGEPVDSSDRVDVYDGAEYNGYEASTILTMHPTFTDTMKNYHGVDRIPFMTLSTNSITKLRVYVYIEGQDIDNYDFAAIGKAISVTFGFTKERFTEDDINYIGPDVNQGYGPYGNDYTPPRITLDGANPMSVPLGGSFTEPGVTAKDVVNGVETDLTADIEVTGTVNTSVAGIYILTYKVADAAGNVATKTRSVIVG